MNLGLVHSTSRLLLKNDLSCNKRRERAAKGKESEGPCSSSAIKAPNFPRWLLTDAPSPPSLSPALRRVGLRLRVPKGECKFQWAAENGREAITTTTTTTIMLAFPAILYEPPRRPASRTNKQHESSKKNFEIRALVQLGVPLLKLVTCDP